MSVESANYINQLNSSYPAATDGLKEGDDHIRLIKSVLQNTFPNLTGPVTKTQADLNSAITGSGGTINAPLIANEFDLKSNAYASSSLNGNVRLRMSGDVFQLFEDGAPSRGLFVNVASLANYASSEIIHSTNIANYAPSKTGSGASGTWGINISGNAAGLSSVLGVANGGTGLSTTPGNGQIDIGNGSGFTRTTLTAGANVSITNGPGSITISATPATAGVTSLTAGAGIKTNASSGSVTVSRDVNTSSVYSDVTYPVGTFLMVETLYNYNINASVPVYYQGANTFSDSGGTAVPGTWRSRGAAVKSDLVSFNGRYLVERVS